LPVLRKAPNVACKARQPDSTMNYNFFANKADKLILLDFIFCETDLRIFDLGSPYGQDICEYKNTTEISSKFDLDNGPQFSSTFQLWTPRFGGDIIFRKVALNPKYCKGHTFRYSTEGSGLIQLYFGGQKDNVLSHSHIGHLTQKGALKWADTNDVIEQINKWNWKEIVQTSTKLKKHLHDRLAIRKIGSYGILPGADSLTETGIKLWGT